MYFGMLFGGHMGHRANNNRICVDQNRDGDWNDGGNWGAYMYPDHRAWEHPAAPKPEDRQVPVVLQAVITLDRTR
jgi:hypothetical protein